MKISGIDAGDDDDAGIEDDGGQSGGLRLSAPTTELALTSVPYPTVTFTLTDDDMPVAGAVYTIDRTDLGTIDAKTGVFTPSGAAGNGHVNAMTDQGSAHAVVRVTVALSQEGDPGRDKMPEGAGGVGGVGGEGGVAPRSTTLARRPRTAVAEVPISPASPTAARSPCSSRSQRVLADPSRRTACVTPRAAARGSRASSDEPDSASRGTERNVANEADRMGLRPRTWSPPIHRLRPSCQTSASR